MLIPNHPDDERLAALASGDPDATADRTLTDHVSTCARCSEVVRDVSTLRAALAEMPDLTPPRPLRLLPDVAATAPSRADGFGGWARRVFAPMLTAGAALALVGFIGTGGSLLGGMAASGGAGASAEQSEMRNVSEPLPSAGMGDSGGQGLGGFEAQPSMGAAEERASAPASAQAVRETPTERPVTVYGNDDLSNQPATAPSGFSPWPLVLLAGVVLMLAAGLMRWVIVPRAGPAS